MTQAATDDSQINYKLGMIEAQVKSLNDNIISAIHRLEDRISESSRISAEKTAAVDKAAAERTAAVETTTKEIGKRLVALEAWQQGIVTKIGFIVSAVSVFWLVFGQSMEEAIQNIF